MLLDYLTYASKYIANWKRNISQSAGNPIEIRNWGLLQHLWLMCQSQFSSLSSKKYGLSIASVARHSSQNCASVNIRMAGGTRLGVFQFCQEASSLEPCLLSWRRQLSDAMPDVVSVPQSTHIWGQNKRERAPSLKEEGRIYLTQPLHLTKHLLYNGVTLQESHLEGVQESFQITEQSLTLLIIEL